MIGTSLQTFQKYASQYKTIPMSEAVVADTKTPIQLFQLFDEQAAFILESKDPLSAWANFSFIGLSPKYFLVEKEGLFLLEDVTGQCIHTSKGIQDAWQNAMDYINTAPLFPDIPFPGGAVGYLSFESYGFYEPKVNTRSTAEPNVHFVFCETILAYHHEKEEITVIHLQSVDKESANENFQEGRSKIRQLLSKIENGLSDKTTLSPVSLPVSEELFDNVKSNYSKLEFIDNVKKIKEYIEAGDIFQAVFSQRFEYPVKSSGLDLYRVLRKVNPSPYLYYLRLGEQEIIGSSPERLIKVNEERELEIHPIAGTRPRGKTKAEDRQLADELLNDEKEKAEHLMLLDLARNDIGKVSEFGSVQVKDIMTVTYFSRVMHLITKVYGQLKQDLHPLEAVFSAHPAGTVSGAPKVRAVEILQELENDRRGVYAGAIAYYGFNGTLDSCLAIRTIVLKNGTASVQAGAGIVYDSDPEKEWEETRTKASALLYAIKVSEQRFNLEEVY